MQPPFQMARMLFGLGMRNFFRNNGLSIAFLALFLISIAGQAYTGYRQYNKELEEQHASTVTFSGYLSSGHFIQSTFENWESEFLQMAMFVWLSIFLFQKGSSESKKFNGTDEVDKEPSPRKKNVPWPVKKGKFILSLYKNSLTIALAFLWLMSFALHFYGSLKDENTQHLFKGEPAVSASAYLTVLSIYLRQKGSPQSKPVDAPYDETGE